MNFFTVKHSFNAGDLIVLLSGIRHLYEDTGKKTRVYQRLNLGAFYYEGAVHPIESEGKPVCMNQQIFDMMKPLIESQEYIESFQVWQGEEVEFDIDLTRDSKWIPMPSGLIHHWAWALVPAMACDLSKNWLSVTPKKETENWDINFGEKKYIPGLLKEYIIINKTERYFNPYISYFFLKPHEDKIIFSGTEHEHEIFCKNNNLQIPRLVVKDFLELAQAIASCKFFIGNQSLNWHLADSQHRQRILELCPQFPNTFPTGTNGYAFYHQKSLQYYFEKLMNENNK